MQFKPDSMSIDVILHTYQVDQFEFEPPYQREGDIWSDTQKSLFIDSLMRNYPIPTIYLNKKNKGAKFVYEVIDGKQRLSTIISFVNNEFKLKFNKNETGYYGFNNRTYPELQDMYHKNMLKKEEKQYIDNFNSYSLCFQIIQDASNDQIKDIFDRLNRGEALNAAEIIHGNHSSLPIYKNISNIASDSRIKALKLDTITGCPELNSKRRKNILFWANIFLSIHSDPLSLPNDETKWYINGSSDSVLNLFGKYKNVYESMTSEQKADENSIVQTVKQHILNSICNFEIIFNNVVIPHGIARASHLYTLFQYSYFLYIHKYEASVEGNIITERLNKFFDDYSVKKDDPNIVQYRKGMASNSSANRRKRFNALKEYVNIVP